MTRLLVLLAAIGLATVAACSTGKIEGVEKANQPPRVWLSAAPPEGSTGTYTVHMFWGGWDPDGEISHYEYLVSDNKTGVFEPSDTTGVRWIPVVGNDSTFTFTADQLVDPNTKSQVSTFTRSHTFFIRAIDEQGLHSKEPAYRSFTSRTLSPEVSVQVPIRNNFTPAELPPISTYRWTAKDYVDDTVISQDPDSVQWALVSIAAHKNDFDSTLAYLRSPRSLHDWQHWVYYRAPGDSGKFWTTPPQDFGTYMFAIRAKDEAGAITPVLDELKNVRRVVVSRRTTGPLFTVSNIYLGSVQTTSCSTPLTIIDIPAGVPLQFTLTADASSYGGTVAGYRYGWDIADLSDPTQWEIDYTPFVGNTAATPARTFFFGTHTFSAEVIDNSGFCSRIEVKVNIVQFTLEQNLLLVDDFKADESSQAGWNNPLGLGSLPNDAEHDAFWNDMVSDVDGFDPARDVVQTSTTGEVPLTTVARYKSVIWSAYSDVAMRTDYPLLFQFIQFRSKDPKKAAAQGGGKVVPNLLSLTMAAGGHVMLCGQQPIQLVENRKSALRHPVIFLYEMEGKQDGVPDVSNPVGDLSFAYKDLCLETLDFAFAGPQRLRTSSGSRPQYCGVTAYRHTPNSRRDDTMREGNPIDPNFPRITLRPECAAPGKFYQPSSQGVDAEIYNPAYFRAGRACTYVPSTPRSCFQPIYGIVCNNTTEPVYNDPVAFWTSVYANVVAEVPGAVGARSVVFGFPPVLFNPAEIKPAFEYILFDEWKLPRKPTSLSASP